MTTRREFLKLLGVTVVAAAVDPSGVLSKTTDAAIKTHKPTRTVVPNSTSWYGTLRRKFDVLDSTSFGDQYKSLVSVPSGCFADLSLITDNMTWIDAIDKAFQNNDMVRIETAAGLVTGHIESLSCDTHVNGQTVVNVQMLIDFVG